MNAATRVAPFGTWPSPLSAEAAASGSVRFSGTAVSTGPDGAVAWWAEMRPDQAGRVVVCRAGAAPGSAPEEPGPEDLSTRSLVNEYGGGSWWVQGDVLFWVDGRSQRLCRWDPDRGTAWLTPTPPRPAGRRYAAGQVTPDGRWIVCEREAHVDDAGAPLAEVVNDLVAVAATGGTPVVLVGPGDVGSGDFVAGPALSPDGAVLAWLRWDHPDLPWDAAELWAGRLEESDGRPTVVDARRVCGGRSGGAALGLGRAVSVCLPEWSPDGRLWWCDDADDWWQLHAAGEPGLPGEGAGDGLAPVDASPDEVGEPRWVSGGRRYGFTDDGRVVLAASSAGLTGVWVLDPSTGQRRRLPGPEVTHVEHLSVAGTTVVLVGGGPDRPTSVWRLDVDSGAAEDLRRATSAEPVPDPADVSTPEPVTVPTTEGEVVHGLLYPPRRAGWTAPPRELPPLVVRIHGGPTASARAEYSPSVQFWTTRGFAVVDVNYRGSTGYGRRYRDLLRGRWGISDVEDCVAVARGLADAQRVDPARCVIRGGSAGGFTALAALCHHDGDPAAFAAGCSLYGVTDLAALAADTHKFESRYLDGLVGPLPEAAEEYRRRSPLHHAHELRSPVLILQGADDPVVPPSQAEVLLEALRANGVPHAYLLFVGEGHGFRLAATLVRALQAELAFYGRVLGFRPADDLPELELR